MADYTGENAEMAVASWMGEQARLFIEEMQATSRIDAPE